MIELESVSKRFENVAALRQASLRFKRGRVHALLGENGAGKSTMVNILGGFVRPDSGKVRMDGSPLPVGDPIAIRSRGLRIVHQHFMLVPAFSVAENFALSRARGGLRPIQYEPPTSSLGWSINPLARTRNLGVGEQQRVEILRALDGDARYLILDEPTAVLTPDEISDLFCVLRKLANEGVGIVLIAHKLDEVLAVADEITVLRSGSVVVHVRATETSAPELAGWMVGELPEPSAPTVQAYGPTLIDISNAVIFGDRRSIAVNGVDLQIRSGEIVGIGGVDGNGQIELAEAVVGIRPVTTGSIRAPGRLAYIPQDRRHQGLALGMTIAENLVLGKESRSPFLSPLRLKQFAESCITRYEIKAPSPSILVSMLSGGNQQKVVVARELADQPEGVVAVNPTRGLDVRASAFVHSEIRQAAQRGAAVLLISTDLDELAALADRTLYMQSSQLHDKFLAVK